MGINTPNLEAKCAKMLQFERVLTSIMMSRKTMPSFLLHIMFVFTE